MACNNIGLWVYSGTPVGLCNETPNIALYSDVILLNEPVFSGSGCNNPADLIATGFYSNGNLTFEFSFLFGQYYVSGISGCTTGGDLYCIQNQTGFDGTYNLVGVQDKYPVYTSVTNNTCIYYSVVETRWCLASSVGSPCVQFGPFASTSSEPDFDVTVGYAGLCVTPPVPPVDPCLTFDFEAIFDCLVPITPSPTPTNTPTPTPTPTPSASNPCGGVTMTVTSSGYTPTPTPTMTPTPTPSPQVTRPCNFSGEVIFNAFSEYLQCANSKKFKDCFTGIDYYTSNVVLVSGTTAPKEGYVYNATINGQGYCVIYEGLVENVSGIDNISLTNEIGSYVNGACLDCLPNLTSTPTPTPTTTPTPTPSPSPCVSFEYRITNESPAPIKFNYITCDGSQSQNVPAFSSIIICASVTPITTSPNIQIDPLGSTCV
jgi:hypothetical protein